MDQPIAASGLLNDFFKNWSQQYTAKTNVIVAKE